ncbi:hypothetical protein ATG66_2488 [Vibrio sp. ES.051]|uniref:hypothetical protein n=1 Tax=Vibrio sp. ES.051 TaxID=1761909 RepID=UPI000BF281B2|nr:hypothetical protein [Vibrio sp. ES.051]PFG56162.1 hypothetical protein ATG66_2488 [Vibrio sp. ES.051]
MAITIRDTEKHEEMLSTLSSLTRQSTKSKALIEGGYTAIRYEQMYKDEKERRERLQRELYDLRSKVNRYVSAFSALSEIE